MKNIIFVLFTGFLVASTLTPVNSQTWEAFLERHIDNLNNADNVPGLSQQYSDEAIQKKRNGLFYHSLEAHYSWVRGNGWMAVGMAELLRILPKDNPDRDRIMTGYKKMMEALLKYQAEDGMWRQIIDDSESWKETSCTAMFTYGMITGVKNKWLNNIQYKPNS